MTYFIPDDEKRLKYAFGHAVGSIAYPEDAHSADSADLANDVFTEVLCERERELVWILAEQAAERIDRDRRVTVGSPAESGFHLD